MTDTVIHFICKENGNFPNNEKLAVCIFRQVFDPDHEALPSLIEQRFSANSWPAAWRNGLYDFHHFHSTAHEALGIYSGWVEACFGGPNGIIDRVSAGDVIIIPASVSHKNMRQADNFKVVGAYPAGQHPNMMYGKQGERPQTDRDICKVVLPVSDPVLGADGPLLKLWT